MKTQVEVYKYKGVGSIPVCAYCHCGMMRTPVILRVRREKRAPMSYHVKCLEQECVDLLETLKKLKDTPSNKEHEPEH